MKQALLSLLQNGMRTLILTVALFSLQSCYHYRISPVKFDPGLEYRARTVHSLFWGAAQKPKILYADDCVASNKLDEVRMTTNLGYAVLTVATLGIWCPMKVEWKCAKPCAPHAEASLKK